MSFRLFEDDPFFTSPPSMFGRAAFPMLGAPTHGHQQGDNHGHRRHERQVATMDPFSMLHQMDQMMNEAFSRHHRMMNDVFGGLDEPGRGRPHPHGRSSGGFAIDRAPRSSGSGSQQYHSSSSVIHFSNTGDGAPTYYHATSSETCGPDGVRETRKTEADSRTGRKKMAIGHHIGDRSHTIEKRQDMRTKEMEQHQHFINLTEDDAETFDREWTDKTRSFRHPSLGMQHHQRDRFAGRRGLEHGFPVDVPPPGHTPGPRGQRSTRSRSPERHHRDTIDVDALPTYPESEAQRRRDYLKSKGRNEKKVRF